MAETDLPFFDELKIKFLKIKGRTEEFTLTNIPYDTSVLDLQKAIFAEKELPIEEQYLYFKSPLDSDFFKNLENLFRSKPFVAKEKVLDFLSKVLGDSDMEKMTFRKQKISKDFILDFLESSKIKNYFKPLNISFQNGMEMVDLKKVENLGQTFVESRTMFNLTNFQILNSTLFLYSKKDVEDNLENEDIREILSKYFLDITTSDSKDKIQKKLLGDFSIYEPDELSEKFQEKYSRGINDFISNKMTEISFLINNYQITECDVQKIFNMISLDEKTVFSKISIRRKKQYYKIFKPKYFGDEANISRKQFVSWRLVEFSSKEKEVFDISSFVHFKILYLGNEYISILINSKNQILVKAQSKLLELEKLKTCIFSFLEKLKKDNDCFRNVEKIDFMKTNNYNLIDITYVKQIQVEENIPIKNLRSILDGKSNYIFPLDFPLNEKQFLYGYKRTSNFLVDKNINHLIEKTVIIEKKTDINGFKKYLRDIFIGLNIDEKFQNFVDNYEDERKSKYKLEIPNFSIITKENKFVITMKNFDNIYELKTIEKMLETTFLEFMVKKSTKGAKEEIKLKTPEPSEESNNSESNNNSEEGLMLGNSNSNSNSENNEETPKANTPAPAQPTTENVASLSESNNEIDISFPFDGKNYTSYMKAMRTHYDKELFDGKKYTTNCRRQPYIISKQHFNQNINLPNRFNTLNGLDVKAVDDSTGSLMDSRNYYLDSLDGKKVYICPRIWCALCNIPVDPIYFGQHKKCPKCGGKQITKTGKFSLKDKMTVKIVAAENDYYKEEDPASNKNYLSKIFGDKPIPEELKGNEMRMYPKFLDKKKNPENKGLPCCYKGMSTEIFNPKEEPEVGPQKSSVLEQKVFSFLTEPKFPSKKSQRLATLTPDLDILLDNNDTNKILERLDKLSQSENKELRELNSKKKLTANQLNRLKDLEVKKKGHEYSFKFYGKRRNIGFKSELTPFKYGDNYIAENLFRLTVGKDRKESFLNCIEELTKLSGNPRNISEQIMDDEILTPSLFCQLNNGNMIEIFRSTVEDESEYEIWKTKFNKDLKNLKIKNEAALRNLYSSYTNFRNYHFSDSVKNPEFYLDLLSREGVIFDEEVNIVIIEKTSYVDESNLNLICPKSFLGAEHIDLNNNTIIITNTGSYYEPIVGVRFISKKQEIDKTIPAFETIFKFSTTEVGEDQIMRSNITSLLKLLVINCNELRDEYQNNIFTEKIENLSSLNKILDEESIDKYIIGLNFKIIGILLKNKTFLPIIPSGIQEKYLKKMESIDHVNKKLLKYSEYKENIKGKSSLKGYKIKSLISKDENIVGGLLENGGVIPFILEKKGKEKTLDFEDITLDLSIIGGLEEEDDRVRFNMDYNNDVYQQQKVKYIFNSYVREEENEDLRNSMVKLVANPVMPLKRKKARLETMVNEIFREVFEFGDLGKNPDIFKDKSKKTKKCYKLKADKCDKECKKIRTKCKNFVTDKNVLTGENNLVKYKTMILKELLKPSTGKEILTKKMNFISELDVKSSKDNLIFPDDMFEVFENELFKKTKQKFIRPIDLFNTIGQKSNINIDQLKLDEVKGKTRTKVTKKGKDKVKGTIVNLFGNRTLKKNKKVKEGECIFPYKITLKQKVKPTNTKKTSVSRIMNECVPTIPVRKGETGAIVGADGIFCPTKVDKIYDAKEHYNNKGKHKFWKQDRQDSQPYYLYEESDDARPKGFCDMREYINRQKRTTLKNKKINPKCIPRFKTKKASDFIPSNYTEDGKEYTCIIENNPDKITDKFIPQLICPTQVDENGLYDRVKNQKTDSCFVDK